MPDRADRERPGPPAAAARGVGALGDAFRYKDRMRVAWEAAGLRVPRYRVLHRKTDLRPLATWRFPVVLSQRR